MHAVGHGLNADRAECRRRKRQHVAAMLPGGIPLTITWQCDVIGIPAVQHSNTEPVGQTNRPIFIYRSQYYVVYAQTH